MLSKLLSPEILPGLSEHKIQVIKKITLRVNYLRVDTNLKLKKAENLLSMLNHPLFTIKVQNP